MRRFINPLKVGLLGGLANWANTMEKYNLLNAQTEGRKQAYAIKYGAQEHMAEMRAKANLAAHYADAESRQRTYQKPVTTADGKQQIQLMRRHLDPQDPTKWTDTPIGDPYDRPAPKGSGPVVKTFREGGMDVSKQWDPDKKEWVPLSSGPHFNPDTGKASGAADARAAMVQGELTDRMVTKANDERDRLRTSLLEKDKQAWRDMTQRKMMMSEAGLAKEDPNSPETRQKYLDWKADELKKTLPPLAPPKKKDSNGANSPGSAEDVSPPNVASDPDGHPREVRYGPNGQAYMMDKNHKPVPVHINEKGIAPDAPPLALSDPGTVNEIAQAGAPAGGGGGGEADEGDAGQTGEEDGTEDDTRVADEEEPTQEQQDANDAEDENDDEQQFNPQPRAGLSSYG